MLRKIVYFVVVFVFGFTVSYYYYGVGSPRTAKSSDFLAHALVHSEDGEIEHLDGPKEIVVDRNQPEKIQPEVETINIDELRNEDENYSKNTQPSIVQVSDLMNAGASWSESAQHNIQALVYELQANNDTVAVYDEMIVCKNEQCELSLKVDNETPDFIKNFMSYLAENKWQNVSLIRYESNYGGQKSIGLVLSEE